MHYPLSKRTTGKPDLGNGAIPDGTVAATKGIPLVARFSDIGGIVEEAPGVAVTLSQPPLETRTIVFGRAALSQALAELESREICARVERLARAAPDLFGVQQEEFRKNSDELRSPLTSANMHDYIERSLVRSFSVDIVDANDRFLAKAYLSSGETLPIVFSAAAIAAMIGELTSNLPHVAG